MDQNKKESPEEGKMAKGNSYFEKMTLTEWFQFWKDLPLKMKNSNNKELKKYIDSLHEHLSTVEDPSTTMNFFKSEIKKLDLEIFTAKAKKNNFQISLAQEKLLEVYRFLEYFMKSSNKKEPVLKKLKPDSENSVSANEEEETKLPNEIEQISYTALISKEELLNDFMLLNTEKNPINGEPFMEKKDVVELVEKNFTIFRMNKPFRKYFPLNLKERQKYILRNFIYKIYDKYEILPVDQKEKYGRFLINNFRLFKGYDSETLCSNMRLENPKKIKKRFEINLQKQKE